MELKIMPRDGFDRFYCELSRSFPVEERRDRNDAEEMLEREEFSVFEIINGGEVIGFISVWSLLGFAFAEHFVITERHRNRGYGREVIELMKKKFSHIVLEAEPPFGEIQRRRLVFYKRCGFFENEQPYRQPSYRKGSEAVPLVIMSYPDRLTDFDGTVREIYRAVYGL